MPVTPLPPGTASEGYYIDDEDRFAGTAAQLDASLFLTDTPDAAAPGGFVSRAVAGAQLRALLASPAGNAARLPLKIVRNLVDRDALDPLTMCLETECVVVDNAAGAPKRYRLKYTPFGTPGSFQVWVDGFNYGGNTSTGQWVDAASPLSLLRAFSEDPAGYVYAANDLRRGYVSGATEEQIFRRTAPGPAAAPADVAGDANWAHVNAADAPQPNAATWPGILGDPRDSAALMELLAEALAAWVPAPPTTGGPFHLTATAGVISWQLIGSSPPPAPTITSFSPGTGAVGATVTLSGTNLTGATVLTLNGLNVPVFTPVSATLIDFTVPAGATTGPIAVTTPGGTATSTGSFAITAAAPAPFKLTFSGDSIFTNDYGTPGTPAIINTHYTGNSDYRGVLANYSTSGHTIRQQIQAFDAAPFAYDSTIDTYAVVEVLVNSCGLYAADTTTPLSTILADIQADLLELHEKLHAVGPRVKTIACTALAAGILAGQSYPDSVRDRQFELIQRMNTWLRSNYRTVLGAECLCDRMADSWFDELSDAYDATKYQDHVHPTQAARDGHDAPVCILAIDAARAGSHTVVQRNRDTSVSLDYPGSTGPPFGFPGIVAPATIENDDARMVFTVTTTGGADWLPYDDTAASGGNLQYSNPGSGSTIDAAYTFTNDGQAYAGGVRLYGPKSANGADFEVLWDGVVVGTGSNYDAAATSLTPSALLCDVPAPGGDGVHTLAVRMNAATYTFAKSNLFCDLVELY